MADDTAAAPTFAPPRISLAWDTNTATAVLVLGALAFIIATRRGFRPALVS